MGTWKQAGRSRVGVSGIWIAVLVGVAALAIGLTAQDRAQAQEEDVLEGAMVLGAEGEGVSCSGDSCDVPVGGDFALTVSTAGIPDSGYIGMQTQVYYRGVQYLPTEVDETYTGAGEDVWPDNDGQGTISVRAPQQLRRGWVAHGGASDILPPFDEPSTYEGPLIQLAMRSPERAGSHTTYLLAYDQQANPQGASYSGVNEDGSAQITVPVAVSGEPIALDLEGASSEGPYPIGDSLVINCAVEEEPTEEPTDEPEEPTSTPPEGLPPTGAAAPGAGSAGSATWALMAVLIIAGAGLLTAGWTYARGRRTS